MPTPDPIPALKQQVAAAIVERLEGWTQPMAAELLRTDQPRVSDLRNRKLQRLSLEQLIRYATRIRAAVVIDIAWPP